MSKISKENVNYPNLKTPDAGLRSSPSEIFLGKGVLKI